MNLASDAGYGEHGVDPPVQPHHLSGSGPATCKHSTGKSLFLRLVLPRGDGRSDVEKPIAAGPSESVGHCCVYVGVVR